MNRIAAINLIIFAAIVVIAAVCTSCKSRGSSEVKSLESVVSENINTEENESIAAETEAAINCPDTEYTENNGVKLPEKIISEDGSITKFEYDDKNRLVKIFVCDNGELMGTFTITYNGNDLVSYALSYDDDFSYYWGDVPDMSAQRRGNTIYVNEGGVKHTINVNDEGYIVDYKTEHPMAGVSVKNYQYVDNKLFRIIEDGWVRELRYDNEKSPFYNSNTPKWFMQFRFFDFALNNNVTAWKIVEGSTDHQYEYENEYIYDNEGFPTKQTKTEKTMYDNEEGYVSTKITYFYYRGQ